MLSKKQVFNIAYAVALIGAITACVGILNELLQTIQLRGVEVSGLTTYSAKNFWVPFFFYLISFIIGTAAVTLVLLHLLGYQKLSGKINYSLIIAMAVLFVMSLVIQYTLWRTKNYLKPEVKDLRLSYYGYLTVYTFRSAAMSLILHLGIILGCNIIDQKYREKVVSAEEGEKIEG